MSLTAKYFNDLGMVDIATAGVLGAALTAWATSNPVPGSKYFLEEGVGEKDVGTGSLTIAQATTLGAALTAFYNTGS